MVQLFGTRLNYGVMKLKGMESIMQLTLYSDDNMYNGPSY